MNPILLLAAALVTIGGAISENDFPDLRYVNALADPCDDFYEFSCGNFKNFNSRRNGEQSKDLYSITEDELIKTGIEILSLPKSVDDPKAVKKVKAAYKACVDVDQIDIGTDMPELNIINDYGGFPMSGEDDGRKFSWKEIGEISGKYGVNHLFKFSSTNIDPENYVLIMLPDTSTDAVMMTTKRARNLDEILEESFKRMARTAMLRSIAVADPLEVLLETISEKIVGSINYNKLLTKQGIQDDLGAVKVFMSQLYSGGILDDDMKPLAAGLTIKELQNWTNEQFGEDADMNWMDYLSGIFQWSGLNLTEDQIIYHDGGKTSGILNLIRKTDPKVVKNYILLRTLLYLAPDSTKSIREAFETYYRTTGLQTYNRQEYCSRKLLDLTDTPVSLSLAVAYAYQRHFYNPNKIGKIVEMIGYLKDAFHTLLEEADWLDKDSRDATEAKVNNMVIELAYPEIVKAKITLDSFYGNLRICEWDNYGNAQRIRAFRQAYALSEYSHHNLWQDSPFQVNAYTHRSNNKLIVPIGILQEGFYNGNSPVMDFSRLGFVIAHEMTHNFDSEGINYNPQAYYGALLSNASSESFQNKKKCMVNQYSRYYVRQIDTYVNGSTTIDENLADNGGIRKAYRAFKKFVSSEVTSHQHFSWEQLFFTSFATSFCSNDSDDYLKMLISSNPHAPANVRVNGILSNLKEFSEAFNCPIGSKMNPEEKCIVW